MEDLEEDNRKMKELISRQIPEQLSDSGSECSGDFLRVDSDDTKTNSASMDQSREQIKEDETTRLSNPRQYSQLSTMLLA